ncbi:hypothetical protein VOLCADRAFT_86185 [Volvox carteri f. nagariensis]|uniref:Allene oxide cyclase barrel-like domain-containing protein n=1 Tax=Volvox carteri f. nagariensis TaxID=3068 RepID=D8TI39_VOLCA|nr:uncharacterized protein VOLCADRAFT_86185 [Volvox carteri f. nagariensis]EFJ52826.1 hypothetical protein VOLCADRAFT_86185 [Volvox carteri f. nagariensis]|eukprot:XP_002945831.1 hypothetical protein VOLCADRAFT_86185 [Volvox carteri f. nagariensis]
MAQAKIISTFLLGMILLGCGCSADTEPEPSPSPSKPPPSPDAPDANPSPPPPKPEICRTVFNITGRKDSDNFLYARLGSMYGHGTVLAIANSDIYEEPDRYIVSSTSFVIMLPHGQIAVQGVWVDKLDITCTFPIVGGTGNFTGATGQIDMTVASRSTYLFTLKMDKDSC